MIDPENHSFETCANCGTPFQSDVTYPAVTRRDDGDVNVYSFCDQECQAAWTATN